MPRFSRRLSQQLNEKLRSPETIAAVAEWEGKVARRRRENKVEAGVFRGVRVTVYKGYVAGDEAKVLVRVTETPELPGDSRIPYWEVIQQNLRMGLALAINDVEVTVRVGDLTATGRTDQNGFVPFSLPAPDLRYGWHDVLAITTPIEGGKATSGTGRILNPDPQAPFAVISDIDDTILQSGLTEGLNAVRNALLNDANTRSAIPGMASFYRGLARGITPEQGRRLPEPAFFYVSTGSWTFYDMLNQFVQLRAFPVGPMFLSHWGPTERYLRRSGAEHKRLAIRRLMESYPDTKFVLIGDSGQRDAAIYEECAREYADQVLLILIRQVGEATEERNVELAERATGLRGEGIPLYLIADAAHGADLAEAAGLCDSQTELDVRTELGPLH